MSNSSTTNHSWETTDKWAMELAIEQAATSYREGGIPIGSVLVTEEPNSAGNGGFLVLGSGHNERIQKSSPTLHAEISALENAGRLKAEIYRRSTIYTTLSPCSMCTGAILLYKIPRVVIGENSTFLGGEALLREHGVEVIVQDNDACKVMMARFISEKPEEWDEDIGEVASAINRGNEAPSPRGLRSRRNPQITPLMITNKCLFCYPFFTQFGTF